MEAVNVLAVIVTFLIGAYSYFKWTFHFWKRFNVPYVEPSIPFGTSENPFGRSEYIGYRIKKRYDEFKAKGHKHGGLYFFTNPVYLPVHVDYIKNVMAKDFRYFTDRGVYCNERSDPLTANLFFLAGERWKVIRNKLAPTFTQSKIKMMFSSLIKCGDELKAIMDVVCSKQEEFEVKKISSYYTIDVIGSCAFGLDINSFSNPQNEFVKHGNSFWSGLTELRSFSIILSLVNPKLAHFLNVQTMPKDITSFFMQLVKDTVEYREKKNFSRKDFMQIMIDLKKGKSVENGFTVQEMAAQSFAFFVAGYDTSSTTISLCLYEMAKHNYIQEKARHDILNSLEKYHGEMTFESVTDMTYLDQVIDETLRKYPPVGIMTRVCVEDYTIPDDHDVTIKKGTKVAIPIYAVHHDPEYYPNPDIFDPERFSEENINSRPLFSYLPFGAGPRICTGLRIGLLQVKIALIAFIGNFEFSVNPRTREPLDFENANFALQAKGGIWLNVSELAK
ncbi:hypothetical protein FQA39_LY16819 [Lamprigera yunnana]|nr:hypothetical protein FQA39_LY16819 [Lamprigera yunnana]